MAKKQRMPRNGQMYNRPTKAYQQNVMKNMPDMADVPDMPTRKKMLIMHIVAAVVVIGLSMLLYTVVSWWATLIALVLVVAYFVGFSRFLNKKQKEVIKYYQKMGMTKKMFYNQMEHQQAMNAKKKKKQKKNASEINKKNNASFGKLWDSVAGYDNVKLSWIEKILGY